MDKSTDGSQPLEIISAGLPPKSGTVAVHAKVQCRWNATTKRYLIDTLLEKLGQGHAHADSGFKKHEWTWIVADFKSRSHLNYNKQQLQSEYNIMKKQYGIMSTIRNNSGFGWDNENNVPTAPENVWKEYLRKNSESAKYRTPGSWEFYDDFVTIFDGQVATGEFAVSSNSGAYPSKRSKRTRANSDDDDDDNNNGDNNDDDDIEAKEVEGPKSARRISTTKSTIVSPTVNLKERAVRSLEALVDQSTYCSRSIAKLKELASFNTLPVESRVHVMTCMGLQHNAEIFCSMEIDEQNNFVQLMMAKKTE